MKEILKDLEAWRRVQEVNLTSIFHCCQQVLPYMVSQVLDDDDDLPLP